MNKRILFAAFALIVSSSVFADAWSWIPSVRSCRDPEKANSVVNTCLLTMDDSELPEVLSEDVISEFGKMAEKNNGTLFVAVQSKGSSAANKLRVEMLCAAAGVVCHMRDVPVGTGLMFGVVNILDRGAEKYRQAHPETDKYHLMTVARAVGDK